MRYVDIKKQISVVIITLLLFSHALANCLSDAKLQQKRSRELQQLVQQDQNDRKQDGRISLNPQNDWNKIAANDLAHLKMVEQIAAENCLNSSQDYLAASLIYQHGTTSQHYYQAYLWAREAAELGNANAKNMMALTIDRYLVSTGRKQLFGSQFLIKDVKSNQSCYCIQEIETSFPDSLRKKLSGYTLQERAAIYRKLLQKQKYCQTPCGSSLKPTPKNSVPGLW